MTLVSRSLSPYQQVSVDLYAYLGSFTTTDDFCLALSLSHTNTHTQTHTRHLCILRQHYHRCFPSCTHACARARAHTHSLSLSHTLSHDMHTSAALPPTLSVLPSAIPTNAGAAVGRPAACAMVPPLTLPRSCVTRMPGWVSRRVEVGGKTWVRTHSIVREHIL